jgi:SRSO17 transposase
MAPRAVDADWQRELETWLEPFLRCLRNTFQRDMAPVYLRGLMGRSVRKSIEPMSQEVAPGKAQTLHHFVSVSPWETKSLLAVLVEKAQELVGGQDAALIVDDTAVRKKGSHSVGVGWQYCGEVGKLENCQSLVSLTLAREEVPVCIGLALFVPEVWAHDAARRGECGIPQTLRYKPKWQIALEEIDRVVACGACFGCVLADAAYGMNGAFRRALNERKLVWAVGIESHQQVYSLQVDLKAPKEHTRGRPGEHPVPTEKATSARVLIESLGKRAFRQITWRTGTKGPLHARFATARVRVANGAKIARGERLPGEEAWLVCEWRSSPARTGGGEKRYYLSNLPRTAAPHQLARLIKARWVCEQSHQQMKQELGLDHFEGRSWKGLHHHLLLTMIAFAYLQYRRLRGKKRALKMALPRNRACQKSGGK